MGYYNNVFEVPDRRRSKLRAIGRSISKRISRIKWRIRFQGRPIRFTYEDAKNLIKHPTKKWAWDDQIHPTKEEIQQRVNDNIIPWLHETITRAPVPEGIDGQGIVLRILKDKLEVGRQCRMIDKYGWRKEGKRDTAAWLLEILETQGSGTVKVTAFVCSVGRTIAEYGYAKQ